MSLMLYYLSSCRYLSACLFVWIAGCITCHHTIACLLLSLFGLLVDCSRLLGDIAIICPFGWLFWADEKEWWIAVFQLLSISLRLPCSCCRSSDSCCNVGVLLCLLLSVMFCCCRHIVTHYVHRHHYFSTSASVGLMRTQCCATKFPTLDGKA